VGATQGRRMSVRRGASGVKGPAATAALVLDSPMSGPAQLGAAARRVENDRCRLMASRPPRTATLDAIGPRGPFGALHVDTALLTESIRVPAERSDENGDELRSRCVASAPAFCTSSTKLGTGSAAVESVVVDLQHPLAPRSAHRVWLATASERAGNHVERYPSRSRDSGGRNDVDSDVRRSAPSRGRTVRPHHTGGRDRRLEPRPQRAHTPIATLPEADLEPDLGPGRGSAGAGSSFAVR